MLKLLILCINYVYAIRIRYKKSGILYIEVSFESLLEQ